MSEVDPFPEHVRDYSLGFMDSLTVGSSIAGGLVASGFTKEMILIAIIVQTIAGSLSMGLADYIGVDSIESRKDVAWLSALRVAGAFAVGAIGLYVSYYIASDPYTGLRNSVIYSIIALILFGQLRAYFLNMDAIDSTARVFTVGTVSLILTFYLSTWIK
jgi:VIT1/CCC1 family predicted Fe2+/Mn2+ transporter